MFKKIRCPAALAILFLFVSLDLFAQAAKPIPRELRFGSWNSGYLAEGELQWFSVRTREAGFVVVETSGDLDTYLEAYDSFNTLIAEDDDDGEDQNAKVGIAVEANKTYFFSLRGYDENESGSFGIRASFGSLLELHFGNWVSGTLEADEEQWFIIGAPETGVIMVETAGSTDTLLKVYSVSGSVVAEDDDGGDGYNALLEFFAEAGKTYRIKLSHYEDERSPYRILASFEPLPPDTERNTDRSRAVPIRLGEGISVYLRSSSESRWYSYNIPRAGTLFVVQTRGNLDTVMALYDAQGNLIEEDDDSGEDGNALISRRLGPGTVYIMIREYEGLTGHCTLHAEIR